MAEERQVVTHTVTTPNKRPLTDIEVLRGNMEGEFAKTINSYYAGNSHEALAFRTAAVDYVRRIPKLLGCSRISLLSSLAQVAQFRFMPSGVSGEAYIIPYNGEAKFQLGYQGIVTLLYRTNKIVVITSNIIFQNDVFEYEEGLQAKLVHKPAMFGNPKGEAIGVYTIVHFKDGQKSFKVMDKDGVMAIKDISKAKGSKDSPWNSDLDPERWMWKKTCLIQHAKLLPKTPELLRAIEKDYEGEGLEKYTLDAGGPAVGASAHKPSELPPPQEEKNLDPTPEEQEKIRQQEAKESGIDTIEM